jgi:poly(3-hydroxybutyrate) depolymerase
MSIVALLLVLVTADTDRLQPGDHTRTRAKWLGKVTKDISANDPMWEFFKKHPMK